jgi:type III pantothenate kinase
VILAIDAGNTEITIGLFRGDDLVERWRLSTEPPRTSDELGLLMQSLLQSTGMPGGNLKGAIISSVVPRITGPLADACRRWQGVPVSIIDGASKLGLQLDVEDPMAVGSDRIVNALAAVHLFRRDAIVVDFGTATTFSCVSGAAVFLGGVIAPGVRIAAETLFSRTSRLPAPQLVVPDKVIGRNTEACIRSGVMLGAAEAVDGLLRRIKSEWPGNEVPFVVATGGLASMLAPQCREVERVEPLLTLTGLRIAFSIIAP